MPIARYLIGVVVLFVTATTAPEIIAKPPLTEGETDPVMLDIDPYLISALYGNDADGQTGRLGAEGGLPELLIEPAFVKLVQKHDLQLFSGPMLGDVRPTAAKFWVRTAGKANVQIAVGQHVSKIAQTDSGDDFTAVLEVNGLSPFTEYDYHIVLNDRIIQRDAFRFRTASQKGQAAKYHVAFGSGARYVPANEYAWRNMATDRPLAYLGLDDNVYIDVTHRRGAQRLFYYRRCLSPAYRDLISSVGMYAVWDDHDMSVDDSQGGAGLAAAWKRPNWNVFRQNWNNPHYGGGKDLPGTWHSFSLGDVDFFMTDGRFYRDKKDETMLGPDQKKWLLDRLGKATGKFKVIASGTMWTDDADKNGKDSWGGNWARKERDEIFDFINANKIDGVLLISGDRHRSDIWKIERPGNYPLYEFVSAKLTNVHTHKTRKKAVWSYNEGNFWGELNFDFTQPDPVATFRCVDISGKVIKEFPLRHSELTHAKK